ncbi:MAG: arginine repressor [Bacteroidia bacterium]|nr:arginine repressor [Bacteroidia bacterium]MDW8346265.1 arginine repressor [Bacteroidia bacterium]
MKTAKQQRHFKIIELINKYDIASQEELTKLLHEADIEVTQATLSRDLSELGIARIREGNHYKYAQLQREELTVIQQIVGLEVRSIEHNNVMIVIKTLIGRAQGVAFFIDSRHIEGVLGTMAGDDTIFVIPRNIDDIEHICQEIKDAIFNPEVYQHNHVHHHHHEH